jgi:hypothetical protein
MSRRRIGPPWFWRLRDFVPAPVVDLEAERRRRRPAPVVQLRLFDAEVSA